MAGAMKNGRSVQLLTGNPLAKISVFALILCLLSLVCGFSANAQSVVDGGLTAPEVGSTLGPNLLVNGDFSQGTAGWTLPSACFSLS